MIAATSEGCSDDLLASLLTMAWFVEGRDPYTGGHLWRVAQFARRLASAAALPAADVARVSVGGFLHDIGKIGVPDAILRKPGPLTPSEQLVLQTHPSLGIRMLAGHPLAMYVRPAVESHHERTDGSGYPARLHGVAIPIAARIVAIADAFDAMTSARPYRRGLDRDEALDRIATALGLQFDARFGDVFVALGRGGELDDIIGHSDDGIPLHECALCGPMIVVTRDAAPGDVTYCRNCATEFGVRARHGAPGGLALAATGRRGDAAALAATVDEQLIARVVNESVAALSAATA